MTELLTRAAQNRPVDAPHRTVDRGSEPTGPVWMHRSNPFTRARLADPALRDLVSGVLAADVRVAERAGHAAAELHELVGLAGDPLERKRLLGLARAVRRGRQTTAGAGLDSVAAWEQAVAAQEAAVTALSQEYAAGVRRERRELARQLTDPSLTAALEVVAPEVARQAARYVQTVAPHGEGTSRLFKSERGLLQYVLRAAVRTSPLSQLTAVGLTHAAAGGDHPDRPTVLAERSFCSLDRVMLDYVAGGSQEAAGLLGQDPVVGLPPTSALDGGRLLFLVPRGTGYQRASVALTTPLAQVVAALRMGPVPLSHLTTCVAARLEGVGVGAVEGFVREAVARGMLSLSRPTTDSDLVDLSPRGEPVLDATLAQVRRALVALETAPATARRALLDGLEQLLATTSRSSGRPARVAVTEDRLLTLQPVDPSHWGQALQDLGPAVELLQTYDWLAGVALTLRDVFVAAHGRGARLPLADVAADLVEQATATAGRLTAAYLGGGPGAVAELAGAGSSQARLYGVRRRVEDTVGAAFEAAVAVGAPEVVVTTEQVEHLLEVMPDELSERPLSYAVLVQSLGDGLVLNDGLPGHGMLFSRFLGMDRVAGGRAVERLRQRLLTVFSQPGVRVVEDRSTHGLNVNVHPPVLPDGLQPQDWARLELMHDPLTDSLHVMDGDQRLTVLPLGGGHPGLFPPALSVASGLVIAGRLYNGLPDVFAERHDRDRDATLRVPRLRVGAVVVSRARWYPGDDLTAVLALPDEQERFVALARWRAAHGVPAEVVVKSAPADTGLDPVGAPDAQAVRFRAKPQYVDLCSALCVRVLPRMLERRGGDDAPAIYLEEATPGIASGPHASEWVVEVDRPRRGRFRCADEHGHEHGHGEKP